MLEKMEMGKDTKECFTEMGQYGEMQDGLWGQMMQLDSPELQKSMEELRHRNCKTTFHETQRFQVYLRRDNLLLRLRAIGLQLDFGEDPYSPILVQLLETFCFYASPWRDLELLHL
jgi:hypothetical protein